MVYPKRTLPKHQRHDTVNKKVCYWVGKHCYSFKKDFILECRQDNIFWLLLHGMPCGDQAVLASKDSTIIINKEAVPIIYLPQILVLAREIKMEVVMLFHVKRITL